MKKGSRLFVLVAVIALMLMLIVTGCGGSSGSKWQDGSFTGEGQGNNGPVKVTVRIEKGKIADVKVTEHKETPGISDAAIERVPKAIVEKQTWDVDTVSGATNTSKAIKEAVKAALAQAEKK